MAQILIIDGDSTTYESVKDSLFLNNHTVRGALTGRSGLRVAEDTSPHVVLTDIWLPDMSGIEVVRWFRTHIPSTVCIIMTAHSTYEYARDALRAGAIDWLEKPVNQSDVLSAIDRALRERRLHIPPTSEVAGTAPHALMRLAEVAVHLISSCHDTPTVQLLGREVGHAGGCLRNWCYTAELQPRAFRDFSRALRAVWRLEQEPQLRDANLLAAVDRRTLRSFRINSGGTSTRLPDTVETFLSRQLFVPNNEFVTAVRTALRRWSSGDVPHTDDSTELGAANGG